MLFTKVATLILTGYIATVVSSGGIQEFLLDNGHRYVDILYNSSNLYGFKLTKVFVARIPMRKIERANHDSFGIFMFDPEKDDIISYVSSLISRKIKTSLLILTKPLVSDGINLLKSYLSSLQSPAFFYTATLTKNSSVLAWNQIISVKSGSVINALTFAENSFRIIETYDLHGLEITSTALTWPPYLTIDDCNEFGLECAKNYGYMIDIMEKLEIKYNFSCISQKNVDNDWGMTPKSGPYSINGTWGGVWGDILSKEYDMSLATYTWTSARNKMFSFVPLTVDRFILVMKPQHSEVDFGLFTRAFVRDTWTCVALMASIAFSLTFMVYLCGLDKKRNGMKIMTFMWWIFFTLVNSYYSGVLTMFFTATATPPFETIKDAIQAYPNWRFMFLDGLQGWLFDMYNGAESGDKDFISVWQRYKENPDETTYYSIKNGLELIENGPNVIFLDERIFLTHLKSNPTKQKMHIIKLKEKSTFANLLFYKNSPLLPIFKQGVSNLWETGMERQLAYKWAGGWPKDSGSAPSGGNVLTLGQMVLVFAFMLLVFVISVMVLCIELAFKQLDMKFPTHYLRWDKEATSLK